MFFSGGKFIWITADDTIWGPVRFPLESMLYAVDSSGVVYGCGSSMGKASECMAYSKDASEALWQFSLSEGEKAIGGALSPGVLYITTKQGALYAFGDR
jgi:outer membrane protein assembly factor BamB